MKKVSEALRLLGHRVKDRITRFEGIVTSVSFDVNGCIQAAVNSGVDKDGKTTSGIWIDTKNLFVLSSEPTVEQPDFVTVDGGRELPTK